MSITLGDIITAARDRHPAFHQTRVPHVTIARYLGDYQNELIAKALERDKQFMAQKAVVILNLSGNTAPGTVGANAGDGLPGAVADDGSFSASETEVGSLIDPLLTQAEGAAILVTEHAATSAASTSLSCTAVTRTTNQDLGKLLVITGGKGLGQRRQILSNSANQWVISTGSDGLQWDTTPDTTSLFMVVEPVYTSSLGVTVVNDLPATSTKTGYLVKIDAQGHPFIDWTAPLVAEVEDGVPLPPNLAVFGGTVRYTDGDTRDLTLVSKGRRFDPPQIPAAYTENETLYLCGDRDDWTDIASLEIDYVPVLARFRQLTDLFLLPDKTRGVLVAKAAAFMAVRVAGMADVTIDPKPHVLQGEALELQFLAMLRLTKRARSIVIREGIY